MKLTNMFYAYTPNIHESSDSYNVAPTGARMFYTENSNLVTNQSSSQDFYLIAIAWNEDVENRKPLITMWEPKELLTSRGGIT